MFPLITWKEQAICLQKLQAMVITFSLLNFLEEYLIVKRTLTTLGSLSTRDFEDDAAVRSTKAWV